MNTKLLQVFISLIVVALFLLGCTTPAPQVIPEEPIRYDDTDIPSPAVSPEASPEAVEETTPQDTVIDSVTVEMNSNGFNQKLVRISAGQKVVFVNKDKVNHWPASGPHPIHTGYPGSGFAKCGTADQVNIFDACAGIAPGGSWEFTFTEIGEWAFHDHLNPSFTGTMIVR